AYSLLRHLPSFPTRRSSDLEPIARASKRLPLAEYKKFFDDNIRRSKAAIFHNADIYPPAYDTVMAITWSTTDRAVTIPDRLVPRSEEHTSELQSRVDLVCRL